ncbi:MAG: glycosyltransferase [Desulfovibrio sp.]|jgi:glycosyltransferase involved in cell wall biosynthesis|nr:glycosyltransferase [Desulfovibrio sp.]
MVTQPLRIVQVINVRWFNATAWYGLTLSRLLRDAGHEVLVLALPETEPFVRARMLGFEPVPLNINTAHPVPLAGALRRLNCLLRTFRPHIVNCHRGEGMLFWGMGKSLGHDFVLVRTRGDQRPPKANIVNRRLHACCVDAVIATNTDTARQCRRLLKVPEDRLYVIVGGVDTDLFSHNEDDRVEVRAALGFASNDTVVGLVGRFDAVKGQRELMEAFALVRDFREKQMIGQRGRLRLMLVGFPATLSEDAIQARIKEYGLEDCTVTTGRVGRVSAYINAMDLGVVASQGSEAIARAALEIMSCGVPLMGTYVGVMPDLLPPWALVSPGDSSALSNLLRQAASDVSFRARLREAARIRMATLSESAFLEQSMQVYVTALQRRFARYPL